MESLPEGAGMKTLDEVIKAFEYTYENDAIAWTYGVDALHYLKEYKRYQNTPSCNGHMALVDYFAESQKNKPLTWDELKLMEGRPVWVEWVEIVIGGSYSIRDWFLIEWIDNNNHEIIIRDRHGNQILYRDGGDWQIYRKEHK